MTMKTEYDIVIIGGGLVGASLACALGGQDLSVAVIEAVPLSDSRQPSYNDRTVALAYGSRRIFDGIGIWDDIEQRGIAAIKKIHVSDRGHLGKTRLDCVDQNLDALGYVVDTRLLGAALAEKLASFDNIDVLCPASLVSMQTDSDQAEVAIEYNDEQLTLQTQLIVGADGVQSAVREQASIASMQFEYAQTAIIANVSTERPHCNIAYERFTDTGPLAVLPMPDGDNEHRVSIVWTLKDSQVEAIQALSDEDFLDALQSRFGHHLGRFTRTGERFTFPLTLRRAKEHVRERLALIGNAAHTVHPIAGQGFNLGLRDVAVLAQVLVETQTGNRDIGALENLQAYADWRKRDQWRVIGFTDSMVRLFSNSVTPLALARNIGLVATDILPPLKRLITRQAMGLSGKLPRLARGLQLK